MSNLTLDPLRAQLGQALAGHPMCWVMKCVLNREGDVAHCAYRAFRYGRRKMEAGRLPEKELKPRELRRDQQEEGRLKQA